MFGWDLNLFERWAEIFSTVAVPIILAVFGWKIQNTLSQRSVSQEYVKLAVSLLTEDKTRVDAGLRSWGVDLLNCNAPAKLSGETINRLKAGVVALPLAGAGLLAGMGNGSLAGAPDGKTIAIGDRDGTVRIWDAVKEKPIWSRFLHKAPVTSLAYSSDSKRLLTGDEKGFARVWDVNSGTEIFCIAAHQSAITGVSIISDDQFLITRARDGNIKKWEGDSGDLVFEYFGRPVAPWIAQSGVGSA